MFEWFLKLFKKNKTFIDDSDSESGYAEPSYSENSEFSTNPLDDYMNNY